MFGLAKQKWGQLGLPIGAFDCQEQRYGGHLVWHRRGGFGRVHCEPLLSLCMLYLCQHVSNCAILAELEANELSDLRPVSASCSNTEETLRLDSCELVLSWQHHVVPPVSRDQIIGAK